MVEAARVTPGEAFAGRNGKLTGKPLPHPA
jgi:hypothetical protein